MIAFPPPRALLGVTSWESLPLAPQDYRLSQFHWLCLQVNALMQWTEIAIAIVIAMKTTIVIVMKTTMVIAMETTMVIAMATTMIIIASDGELSF